MYLFKRNGIFYVEFFDEAENRTRRKSSGKSVKSEALKFVSEFQKKLAAIPKINFISLASLRTEYLEYIRLKFSKSYTNDRLKIQIDKNVSFSFDYRRFLSTIKKRPPLKYEVKTYTAKMEINSVVS
jgi:hypothetical protein